MKQYITATNLAKYYGETLIFQKMSFALHQGNRIALIGPNGTGKTTLLRLIAGHDTPDEGELFRMQNISIGYVDQHAVFTTDETIYNIMLTELAEDWKIFERIHELERAFAQIDYESTAFTKISNEYDRLLAEIEEKQLYQKETKIKMLLTKLGFQEHEWQKSVNELSGGQQVRLHLAKTLLQEPEVLLLDEPTNHLDIETIIWLNNYLQNYPYAIIFITHDEKLIDTLATNIWQIINQHVFIYNGNYRHFQKELADKTALLEEQHEKTVQEKQKLATFIDKNKARSSTAGRARSAQKRLDKITDVQTIALKPSLKPFTLPVKRPTGKVVFTLENALIGYSKPLYEQITTRIPRYERLALVGKNGIGKSTLLETLAGNILPLEGTITKGHHVDIAYFQQQQIFANEHQSLYSTFSDVYPDANREIIYPILARFGFSGEDVQLINSNLSGGEKQRLLLALLYYQKANTLLLDEPTNHLDIASKQALITSLKAFDGTFIFASHDREFIEKLATRIFFFHEQNVFEFTTYKEFENFSLNIDDIKKVTRTQLTADKKKKDSHKNTKSQQTLHKELLELETQIETIEQKLSNLSTELLKEAVYSDYVKANALQQEQQQLENQLQILLAKWEDIAKEQEQLEQEKKQTQQ